MDRRCPLKISRHSETRDSGEGLVLVKDGGSCNGTPQASLVGNLVLQQEGVWVGRNSKELVIFLTFGLGLRACTRGWDFFSLELPHKEIRCTREAEQGGRSRVGWRTGQSRHLWIGCVSPSLQSHLRTDFLQRPKHVAQTVCPDSLCQHTDQWAQIVVLFRDLFVTIGGNNVGTHSAMSGWQRDKFVVQALRVKLSRQ